MILTREDMEAWREHPVTELVLDALTETADGNEQQFKNESWNGATPERLMQLRATVMAYRDLVETINAPDAHLKFTPKEG